MVLISINKIHYERRYDLLKLNVKNDIIFAPANITVNFRWMSCF